MPSNNGLNKLNFLGVFSELEDLRTGNATLHQFDEILILALSAYLAGSDYFAAMERFIVAKKEFFSQHLILNEGIPFHDTFGNVFALIDPEKFSECFVRRTAQMTKKYDQEVIAIDGKSLRRSHDKANGKSMLHIVNAWATQNGCILGQVCRGGEE